MPSYKVSLDMLWLRNHMPDSTSWSRNIIILLFYQYCYYADKISSTNLYKTSGAHAEQNWHYWYTACFNVVTSESLTLKI